MTSRYDYSGIALCTSLPTPMLGLGFRGLGFRAMFWIYSPQSQQSFGSVISAVIPSAPNDRALKGRLAVYTLILMYLVAERIHFTLFWIILTTIKLNVYTFGGL